MTMTYSTRSIIVRIAQRTILDSVSLTFSPGRITAIIGPNGSGKSTLIRALSGEIGVFGDIHVNGREINDYRPEALARRRAVLAQANPLGFPFTVGQLVEMGLDAGGVSDPLVRAALGRQALHAVDLAERVADPVTTLSGGQQQRAHLARVLCQVGEPFAEREPRWLLLDEPVAGLDVRHQMMVMAIARQFARAGGGVIAVLHDLDLVAAHADDVVMLDGGRLVAAGPVADIMAADRLEALYGVRLDLIRDETGAMRILAPRP